MADGGRAREAAVRVREWFDAERASQKAQAACLRTAQADETERYLWNCGARAERERAERAARKAMFAALASLREERQPPTIENVSTADDFARNEVRVRMEPPPVYGIVERFVETLRSTGASDDVIEAAEDVAAARREEGNQP